MLEASILLIGDELLAGEVQDQNGFFFAEELAKEGFRTQEIRVLPDEVEAILVAVRALLSRSALLVICGGLGPTSDDLTTEAVAKALGRRLRLDEAQWERIRNLFRTFRGEDPPPGNEKQALIPEGAEVLNNSLGTAPGYVTEEGSCVVAVFPGPPRENRPMLRSELLPWLERRFSARDRWETRVFRVFGLAESEVGHRLRNVEREYPGVRVGYQFSFPEILVKLRGSSDEKDLLDRASQALTCALGSSVYARGEERLPTVLGRRLAEAGLKIVTAESCTGGLAGKLLTDTPGSSAWMEAGFVAYSNEAKERLLGVPGDLIRAHGAVSEPVALAMLSGALERCSAHVGLSITGIAGPEGGTAEKPVGTVCIAWGMRGRLTAHTYRFAWDREYNRLASAWAAMHRLYGQLAEG
jgi:nicotinamide-nucleotide amidase